MEGHTLKIGGRPLGLYRYIMKIEIFFFGGPRDCVGGDDVKKSS